MPQRERTAGPGPEGGPPGGGAAQRGAGLTAYAEALAEACGTVLTGLCGQTVRAALGGTSAWPPPDLTGLPLPWIGLRLPVAKGLDGEQLLLLSRPGAAALAQALGGEAANVAEALRDAATQLGAAVARALARLVGRPVTPAVSGLVEVNDEEEVAGHLGGAEQLGGAIWLAIEGDGLGLGRALLVPSVGLVAGLHAEPERAAARADAPPPFAPLQEAAPARAPASIDLLLDIPLAVTVELGRSKMLIRDILQLGPGSVVELDRLAGEPVDLLVNDRAIGKGEVVVVDENFGVRLTSIVTTAERLQQLS
jgi:flagellar motor switch protein FliN